MSDYSDVRISVPQAGSISAANPAVERAPQLLAEIDTQDEAIERLAKIADVLASRLGPLLRPEPDSLIESQPEEPLVQYAARVRNQRSSVDAIRRRLADVLDRLEV